MRNNNTQRPTTISENMKIKRKQEKREVDDDFLEDLLDRPGTIKNAKIHASAKRILDIPNKFPEGVSVEFCDDCNLPVECSHVKKFDCSVDPKKLASAGYGVYLYFFFIHYIIINLIGIIVIVGIPYVYLTQGYSEELFDYCTEYFNNQTALTPPETDFSQCINFNEKKEFDYTSFDWLNIWSGETLRLYAKLLDYVGKEDAKNDIVCNFHLISLVCLLVLLIVNMFFINLSSAIVNEIDFNEESPSDYSLMISDIPIDQNTPETIKDFLECKNIPIHEVNLTYKLTYVKKAKKELNELKRLRRINKGKKMYTTGFLCCKKEHLMKELNETIKKKTKATKELEDEKDKTFNGLAFIVFNKQDDQELYYKQYPNSFLSKVFINLFSMLGLMLCSCFLSKETKKRWKRKVKIAVSRAPEPQDIIWEHLEYHFISRFLRSCVGYFVSILCIGASFGIVVLLNWGQSAAEKNLENDLILKYGLSVCISLVIQIINFIMSMIFSYFAMLEKPWSYTDYYLSLSIKQTFFTFINSAIIPLVSNIIQYGWESHEMLVNNMLMMFLMASILSPILSAICYDYLMVLAFQWLFELNHKDPLAHIPEKTQKELNELYEYPDMAISVKYSSLVMPFLLTCFYISIFPLGTVITLVGAIFTYFVEKVKFTQIYKKPTMFNQALCYFYIDHFVVALFVYGIGHWVFLNNILKINVYEYINIILFGILVIIPYKKLFRVCDSSGAYASTNEITFENVYFSFQFDYERLNPKTQKQGMLNYLYRLKNIHLITEEQYRIFSEKVNSINVMELYHGMTNPMARTMTRKSMMHSLTGMSSMFGGGNQMKGMTMINYPNNQVQTNLQGYDNIVVQPQQVDYFQQNMQMNNIQDFLMNFDAAANNQNYYAPEAYDDNVYNNVQIHNPQPVPVQAQEYRPQYDNGNTNYYVPGYNNVQPETNDYMMNNMGMDPNMMMNNMGMDPNMMDTMNMHQNMMQMNYNNQYADSKKDKKQKEFNSLNAMNVGY